MLPRPSPRATWTDLGAILVGFGLIFDSILSWLRGRPTLQVFTRKPGGNPWLVEQYCRLDLGQVFNLSPGCTRQGAATQAVGHSGRLPACSFLLLFPSHQSIQFRQFIQPSAFVSLSVVSLSSYTQPPQPLEPVYFTTMGRVQAYASADRPVPPQFFPAC